MSKNPIARSVRSLYGGHLDLSPRSIVGNLNTVPYGQCNYEVVIN